MKHKLFILFLLAFLSTLKVSAQNTFSPGILFNANGIHIEGDKSIFWNGSSGTIWGTGGLSYGIFVSRDFNKGFGASLELRNSHKGALYEYNNDMGLQEYEVLKLHYLEIPVLLAYNGKRPSPKFRFETGLAWGYLWNHELAFNPFSERQKRPLVDGFRKHELSWVSSAKLYVSKRKNLLLGFRFSYSVLSIHEQYDLHNMNFGVEANYILGKKAE